MNSTKHTHNLFSSKSQRRMAASVHVRRSATTAAAAVGRVVLTVPHAYGEPMLPWPQREQYIIHPSDTAAPRAAYWLNKHLLDMGVDCTVLMGMSDRNDHLDLNRVAGSREDWAKLDPDDKTPDSPYGTFQQGVTEPTEELSHDSSDLVFIDVHSFPYDFDWSKEARVGGTLMDIVMPTGYRTQPSKPLYALLPVSQKHRWFGKKLAASVDAKAFQGSRVNYLINHAIDDLGVERAALLEFNELLQDKDLDAVCQTLAQAVVSSFDLDLQPEGKEPSYIKTLWLREWPDKNNLWLGVTTASDSSAGSSSTGSGGDSSDNERQKRDQ